MKPSLTVATDCQGEEKQAGVEVDGDVAIGQTVLLMKEHLKRVRGHLQTGEVLLLDLLHHLQSGEVRNQLIGGVPTNLLERGLQGLMALLI